MIPASPKLSPRKRRSRRQAWDSPGLLLLVAACIVIGVRFLTAKVLESASEESAWEDSSSEESYPGAFIDLWPDDRNTESYRNSLLNCVPGFDYKDDLHDCRVRMPENGTAMVALARPPGLLGDIFEECMKKVLKLTAAQPSTFPIQFVPTTEVIGPDHGYSMIIRMATLPVLLEAADIALGLNETGKADLSGFSLADLVDIIRYTLRWQCHITERVQDTALLTITLDRMIGYPTSTAKKLQIFLGMKPEDSKKSRLSLKQQPLVVMDRINTGSAFISTLFPSVPAEKLLKVVAQLLEEELEASENECQAFNAIGNSNMGSLLKEMIA